MSQIYIRHSTLSINQFMVLMDSGAEEFKIPGILPVNLNSLRLQTFHRKGVMCQACCLTASFFAVERSNANCKIEKYHLNLYGNDGEEVLFTHDHMIARSLGGLNQLSNTIPMCFPCNMKKSEAERDLMQKPTRQKELAKTARKFANLKGKRCDIQAMPLDGRGLVNFEAKPLEFFSVEELLEIGKAAGY